MGAALSIIFCVAVIGAVVAIASLEYYAHKAKVIAAPSVPWMRRAVIARLVKEAQKTANPSPVIYELGSGWGGLAIAAAKALPHAQVVGFEISPLPFFYSKLKSMLLRQTNVRFVRADIFAMSYKPADFILCYLTQTHTSLLRPKFEAELNNGAVVISNTFPVPDWKPSEEETIQNFVYTLKIYTYRVQDVKTG